MRTLLIVAVLGSCCLFAAANTSSAADHSQVPAKMLAEMGLGSMQPMSDAQGMAIRGNGTSIFAANIIIVANVNGAQTNTFYPFSIIQVISIRH